MGKYQAALDWIQGQASAMKDLAVRWAGINSHTLNKKGIDVLAKEIESSFSVFNEPVKREVLPPFMFINQYGEQIQYTLADTLVLHKRPEATKQVLLVCHMDTVYPLGQPFQEVKILDDTKINGPGITDAKGGIIVMLKALEALEQEPAAQNVGWKVILNSDEEIGSPSSDHLFEEAGKQFQFGLVFEPCLSNGNIVGARKGSGTFTLTARGRPAHAGRDFDKGRNAIDALVQCIPVAGKLTGKRNGLTLNAGVIHGGTTANVVAEKASVVYNIRYLKEADFLFAEDKINEIVADISKKTDVDIQNVPRKSADPKPLTDQSKKLFKHVQGCGKELGLVLECEESGGVCDGNRLQTHGLVNIDTLGVRGGAIHSDKEYLIIDSLAERTKLTALLLLKWANGEWDI